MADATLFDKIARFGVLPIIAIESADAALPLADALAEGGLPLVEITFRTAAAAAAIEKICRERPEMLVGAGTLLSGDNITAAKAAGARFGVAPGVNIRVIDEAQEQEFPFAPGICTPSEIEGALGLGCTVQKVFPAEVCGGVEFLKAISAPYGHTGVRFIPTGGVSQQNLHSYLSVPTVLAVGGTWLAKKEDIAAGKWREISERCRLAVETVAAVRHA